MSAPSATPRAAQCGLGIAVLLGSYLVAGLTACVVVASLLWRRWELGR